MSTVSAKARVPSARFARDRRCSVGPRTFFPGCAVEGSSLLVAGVCSASGPARVSYRFRELVLYCASKGGAPAFYSSPGWGLASDSAPSKKKKGKRLSAAASTINDATHKLGRGRSSLVHAEVVSLEEDCLRPASSQRTQSESRLQCSETRNL